MKAARFHAAGDIRVEDVEAPVPDDHKVLVSVDWCGICGSDLTEYIKGPVAIPQPGNPHVITGETPPIIMGHEFCGRVLKAPRGASVQEGQAVMIDPRINCGSCKRCDDGYGYSCNKWGFLGLSGGGGGFAEVVAVEPRMLHVLPDTIPMDEATLIEPLAVGWHAARISGVSNFKDVPILIIGGGPVGYALIFALRAKGANRMYVSEPTKRRREALRSLVEVVIDPLNEKLVEECLKLTGGEGVRAVFDCAGVQSGLDDGLMSLTVKGTYVNIAGWAGLMTIHPGLVMLRELNITGSLAYNEADFAEVVEAFVAGKFKGVEKMITRRIPLKDIAEKGFKDLVENKDDHIKILVTPRTDILG